MMDLSAEGRKRLRDDYQYDDVVQALLDALEAAEASADGKARRALLGAADALDAMGPGDWPGDPTVADWVRKRALAAEGIAPEKEKS